MHRGLRVLMLAWLPAAGESAPSQSPVLAVLVRENARVFAALSGLKDRPAYFLSSAVTGSEQVRVVATFGGLAERHRERERLLDLDLRIGSMQLDQTHRLAGEGAGEQHVTIAADPRSLAADLWIHAERRYRDAAEKFQKIAAEKSVKVDEDDPSPDFCAAPRAAHVDAPVELIADEDALASVAVGVSAVFREFPDVLESSCQITALRQEKSFASSEGTAVHLDGTRWETRIWGNARAEDGMDFTLVRQYHGWTQRDLPDAARLGLDARELGATLRALKTAPLVDPFVGPALLSGRAAAVLFHEVLGHRLEGHRQKDDQADQTFTKRMGKRILPEFITIVSDPTLREIRGVPLMGAYRFDDEGVAARPVTLVDRGILRAFMMSRSPVRGFPESNGHGRKAPGKGVVARQANLLIRPSRTMPVAQLRAELIRRCRAAKKPYGLYFDEIEGGFTFTSRTIPNAFNVMPVIVKRIYADGRPDELVRGVDLIGTPLTTLDRIVAAGDDLGVFNGYCGAESGYVPVAAASPSLLVSEMEIQRKAKGQDRPPLVPEPGWAP